MTATSRRASATRTSRRLNAARSAISRLRDVRADAPPDPDPASPRGLPQHLTLGIAIVLAIVSIVAVALNVDDRLLQPMTAVLLVCMIVANITEVRWAVGIVFSATFVTAVIGVVFLGIANSLAILIVGELIDWLTFRYRLAAVPFNIVSFVVPTLLGGSMIVATLPPQGPVFWIVLVLAGFVFLASNFFTIVTLLGIYDRRPLSAMIGALTAAGPGLAISVAVMVGLIAVLEAAGSGAAALALIGITFINALMRQVAHTQQLARRYFALGWGTVASLMHVLDEREHGTMEAAASAAVLAEDAARRLGLDETERRVVHAATLLRDIGRLAATDDELAAGGSHGDIRRGAALTASLDADGAIAATIRESAAPGPRDVAAQIVAAAMEHSATSIDPGRPARMLVDLGRSGVDDAVTAAVGSALQARREDAASDVDFDAELAVSQRWARRQMRLT